MHTRNSLDKAYTAEDSVGLQALLGNNVQYN